MPWLFIFLLHFLGRMQKSSGPKNKVRKNEEIKVPEIRVVFEDGSQEGVMTTADALAKAKKLDMDLVEIAPQSKPPVCKIMDFGSYLYAKKKEQKKQKSAQKSHSVKEIKFGIRISDHDFEVRTKKARSLLEKGHIVKVILQFRGREHTHPEIGLKRMAEMAEDLSDIARQEFEPKNQGRSIVTEMRPLSKKER